MRYGVRSFGAGGLANVGCGSMGLIEPGQRVLHPGQPDWGVGQVQSVVGPRVTVNFEHRGKVLVNAEVIELVILGDD